MTEDPFGKWWPCLKKHAKRRICWLPHIQSIKARLKTRDLRYFTLCARPMIDIYMLVKEGLLPFDSKSNRISGAYFCECSEPSIGEMRELIGVEESGFCAYLEDLVLFKDTAETAMRSSQADISKYLDTEGEGIDENVLKALKLKRAHLDFRGLFPFDFINLDYCDRYYGKPPNVLKVHQSVEQILEWQTGEGALADGIAGSRSVGLGLLQGQIVDLYFLHGPFGDC